MRSLHTSSPFLAAFCRWLVVFCVLIGLGGQLLLQSNALPDEAPRVTFERLTGLHIGPGELPPASMQDNMQGMSMDMPMVGHMMPHIPAPGHPDHHHDGSCPLCPLLHLPAVIFSAAFMAALILMAWGRSPYSARLPRAPPPRIPAFRPPSTGPPAFI